jgi:hypothetical protein
MAVRNLRAKTASSKITQLHGPQLKAMPRMCQGKSSKRPLVHGRDEESCAETHTLRADSGLRLANAQWTPGMDRS